MGYTATYIQCEQVRASRLSYAIRACRAATPKIESAEGPFPGIPSRWCTLGQQPGFQTHANWIHYSLPSLTGPRIWSKRAHSQKWGCPIIRLARRKTLRRSITLAGEKLRVLDANNIQVLLLNYENQE